MSISSNNKNMKYNVTFYTTIQVEAEDYQKAEMIALDEVGKDRKLRVQDLDIEVEKEN